MSGAKNTDLEIWTTEQCAEFLGVSESTVLRWRHSRRLPSRKLGKVVRYVASEVKAWFVELPIDTEVA